MEYDKETESLTINGEVFAFFNQYSGRMDRDTKYLFGAVLLGALGTGTLSAVFALVTGPFLF